MADAVKIIKPSGSTSTEDRLNLLEKQFRQHNHADGITQPVWVGKVNQGSSNIVIPPSGGVLGDDISNGSALRMGGIDHTGNISQTNTGHSYDPKADYLLGNTFMIPSSGDREVIINTIEMYVYDHDNYQHYFPFHIYDTGEDKFPSESLGSYTLYSTASQEWMTINIGHPTLKTNHLYAFAVNIKSLSSPNGTQYLETWFGQYHTPGTIDYYSGGDWIISYDSGTTWSKQSGYRDITFQIHYTYKEIPAHIYLGSAQTQSEVDRYMGVANKDATKGSDANFISTGFKTDYTDLIAGSPYYLSNSPGIISTTPGSVVQRVGYAYSNKILAIFK